MTSEGGSRTMRSIVLASLVTVACASGAPLATGDGGVDASGPGGPDGCAGACEATCGDGVQEGGEPCDPAIPAGMSGACPGSCDDGDACTIDSLTGAACQLACAH